MSINGITPTTYTPAQLGRTERAPSAAPVPGPSRHAPDAPQHAPAQSQSALRPQPAEAEPTSATTSKPEALTAAAPEGVDPALWSVLTTEERAYFSRVRSLGPLTYGPATTPARPALRGGRIDVTV